MPPSDSQEPPAQPDPEKAPEKLESNDENELQADPQVERVPTAYRLDYLERQYQSLETLFALAVSALIILSLGLNWYLFKRTRVDRANVHQQRLFVSKMQTEFEKRVLVIREFISSLESYAKTDPEFREVLEKYRDDLGQYYTSQPATTVQDQ